MVAPNGARKTGLDWFTCAFGSNEQQCVMAAIRAGTTYLITAYRPVIGSLDHRYGFDILLDLKVSTLRSMLLTTI